MRKKIKSAAIEPKEKPPLAIRCRPRRFAEVVGQDTTISILRGMVKSRRIPGTIALCGPFSSGKTTLARLIALYVNCAELVDGEPCGVCESCKAMEGVILGNGSHPDVHEIDAASQRGIDDVRALKRLAELSPITRRRIFILDECHAYTAEAWQSALKLFERPPGKTTFILCTTEAMKLPNTTRSRASIYNLSAVKISDTAKLLRRVCRAEGYLKRVSQKLRGQIAAAAGGHPRDAFNILEHVFNHIDDNGGSKLDVEKMFPKLVTTSVAMKGYLAAQDFVNAILAGKYSPAFKAILVADNHVSFINQAVGMLRLQIEAWIDKGMITRDRSWLLSKLRGPSQEQGRTHLDEYGEMLALLLNAQQLIRGFVVDPYATLEVAAIECIGISHSILASKRGTKATTTAKN